MRPLSDLPASRLADLRGVFTDIDDTITLEGRLPARAYVALERLKDAGLAVVPITGRPAGWCDMIARFLPVDGVVGENGAFYFAYDHALKRMTRRFALDPAQRAAGRRRLEAVQARILTEVPGAAVAADQAYREADLAIDFCEDVPALSRQSVEQIAAIFSAAGANAKVSSIHVNGWFGDYDKLSMASQFAKDRLGWSQDALRANALYAGDSPNDEPMFAFFPLSVGVANVRDFADRMTDPPAFVTPSRGADGFVELAEVILAAHHTKAHADGVQ